MMIAQDSMDLQTKLLTWCTASRLSPMGDGGMAGRASGNSCSPPCPTTPSLVTMRCTAALRFPFSLQHKRLPTHRLSANMLAVRCIDFTLCSADVVLDLPSTVPLHARHAATHADGCCPRAYGHSSAGGSHCFQTVNNLSSLSLCMSYSCWL